MARTQRNQITNYTFNAATKTITLNDITTVDLSRVISIVNQTRGVTYYTAANSDLVLTVATNIITLNATINTTGHANSDKLHIAYVEDDLVVPARLGMIDYVQSTGNNSSTQLAAGAIFTGTIESALNHPQILLSIRSDQPITITIRQFSDLAGTIAYPDTVYTRAANQSFNQSINIVASYYRVIVQNTGAATTTNFFVETWTGILPPLPNQTNSGNLPVELAGNSSINSNLNIPSTFTDIASAAITATGQSAAITPTFGVSYDGFISVTAVSGTTPTMQVVIEESLDSGTTWQSAWTSPIITATGNYPIPKLPLNGNRLRYNQILGGTTPSFTRSIVRTQTNDSANLVQQSQNGNVNGTITAGGTAQLLLAANNSRKGFEIQNLSSADLWLNFGGTAAVNSGFKLPANSTYTPPSNFISTAAISIFGATTGQQFSYIQY
jgi:hypothetical protein